MSSRKRALSTNEDTVMVQAQATEASDDDLDMDPSNEVNFLFYNNNIDM